MEKLIFNPTIEKEKEMEIYTVKGMNFSEEEIEKAWVEDKPLQIGLAFPRRICNANCPYCYTAEKRYTSKKEDRSMSVEQILNSLEEAKEMGCKQVMIGGYGEPLLNDEFWPVLEKAKEIGLYVMVFSNATLIDRETAQKLKDYPVSFMVKVNSFDEEKQDKLLGKKGLAKKLYDGLNNLIEAEFNQPDQNGQTRLGIHLGICKITEDDIPKVFKWALDRKIFPFIEELFPSGNARKPENIEMLGTDEEIRDVIYPRVVKKLKDEFGTSTNQAIFGEGGSCKLESYSVMLETFSGKGIKCFTRNEDDAGNFFDAGIKGIWDKNQKERKDDIANGCAGCKGRKCAREKNAQQPVFVDFL